MKTAYIKYIVALLLFGSNGVVAVFVGLRQGFSCSPLLKPVHIPIFPNCKLQATIHRDGCLYCIF